MSEAQAAPTTTANVEAPASQSETPASMPNLETPAGTDESKDTGLNQSKDSSADEYLSDEEWTKLSKKKRKLKLGDEDAEMTLEEIAKNTALNKTVTKRGQEAADLKRAAEQSEAKLQQFFEEAKAEPNLFWELMEKLGHNPDDIAIRRARTAYEWSQKSPEERRAIELERENTQLKSERDAERAAKDAESRDAKLQAVEAEIETDITDTIKELGITPDAVTVERIAQAITFLYNRDNKKPSSKDVASFVLQNLEQDVTRYIKKLSPERASELFGKEFIDKFQDTLIKQAEKNLPYAPSKRTRATADDSPRKSQKEVGIDDWFKSL